MTVALGSPETILLVEDDAIVRRVVLAILKNGGFNVLEASTAEEALQIDFAHAGEIHLLLSDVMMAGKSGPELAKQIKAHRPEMRVILMSGYPDGAMLLLNYGWHFIQKPFLPKMLLNRVDHVLHTPRRDQGADHFDTRDEFLAT